MVRRCAVKNCNSTDTNIIAHRFPRSEKSAATWRDALGIKDISLQNLISKYVVCTFHFARTDYRNAQSNFLNSTAIPKKPETDPETPDKYSVTGMLGDYYGKPMSVYRKDRGTATEVKREDKTIMVYEISELQDIEALQDADQQIDDEDEQEVVGGQQQHSTIEVLTDSENDDQDGEEDDEIINLAEYMPQHKKHKYDSETTYVRLENNVVVALGEQEEDDGECYEGQEGDENLEFHDENHENDSIDVLFLEKESSDEHFIDDELVQINHTPIIEPPLMSPDTEQLLDDAVKTGEQHQIENEAELNYDEGEYVAYSRKDLIEKLLESSKKINELETKLECIQGAQAEMVKSIENFKKIFSS